MRSQSEAAPRFSRTGHGRGGPLRLCFVADPGSIHTVRWVRFFGERGHEVAVIGNRLLEADLKVAACCVLSPNSLPGTRILRNVFELRRFLRSFKPEVVHAHYINECGWLGALSGFHPFVLTAWGSDVYIAPQRSRLARVMNPWTVRRADYVTADSQDLIEQLRRMGASQRTTSVVGWGVDLRQFGERSGKRWRVANGIREDQPVILSPRRWVENSNISVILDAFATVLQRRSDSVLVLRDLPDSSTEVARRIRAQVQDLGVCAATRIVGELPEADLPAMYSAADITVSVCSSDGTPASLLEAMAGRSTVIGGDLPSLREWITEGRTGVLVPVGDHRALADRLLRLIEDETWRLGLADAAYEVVRARGDRTRILEGMEEVYRRLAAAEDPGMGPGDW